MDIRLRIEAFVLMICGISPQENRKFSNPAFRKGHRPSKLATSVIITVKVINSQQIGTGPGPASKGEKKDLVLRILT
ncbi:hypothetical protein Pfo_028812 [Paulownia fortunei]|nr:hypothetical protein Pfo_028812 [Paulownia fortunei]